ncbi:MAG: hypothetical protein IJU66_06595 [Oscillospiraceae bacterium]|nr:hypothetical protein [Oscillospiraceae bacterium]
MNNMTAWKSDNYRLVGRAFDYAYANRLNKFMSIVGVANSNSIDYELTAGGGYGEMPAYDGNNLNEGVKKRGFKTIITPEEFSLSESVGYKQAKVDKSGECSRVGKMLGNSAAMTVYMHMLRMFSGAFDESRLGGDGKPWAATDHPVASMGSQGRKFIADPDSGTFSNKITDALSVSNITKAQALAGRMTTPDGLPFLGDYSLLLVSPELEADAKKICGDHGKFRPAKNPADDTNAANPLADLQYMVIGGGTDGFSKKQWAICDPTLMKEMVKLVYITRPTVMQTALDNPLKDLYTGYVDFGCGWGDARQIIFSDPS